MTNIWRDDLKPAEQPTEEVVVTCAEDEIMRDGPYKLVIVHVWSFVGSGFRPTIRIIESGETCEQGIVFLGTDETWYAEAKQEGERLLKQHALGIAKKPLLRVV